MERGREREGGGEREQDGQLPRTTGKANILEPEYASSLATGGDGGEWPSLPGPGKGTPSDPPPRGMRPSPRGPHCRVNLSENFGDFSHRPALPHVMQTIEGGTGGGQGIDGNTPFSAPERRPPVVLLYFGIAQPQP